MLAQEGEHRLHAGPVSCAARKVAFKKLNNLIALVASIFAAPCFMRPQPNTFWPASCSRRANRSRPLLAWVGLSLSFFLQTVAAMRKFEVAPRLPLGCISAELYRRPIPRCILKAAATMSLFYGISLKSPVDKALHDAPDRAAQFNLGLFGKVKPVNKAEILFQHSETLAYAHSLRLATLMRPRRFSFKGCKLKGESMLRKPSGSRLNATDGSINAKRLYAAHALPINSGRNSLVFRNSPSYYALKVNSVTIKKETQPPIPYPPNSLKKQKNGLKPKIKIKTNITKKGTKK